MSLDTTTASAEEPSEQKLDLGTAAVAATRQAEKEAKNRPSARDQLLTMARTDYTIGRTEDDRPYLVPNDGPNVALLATRAKANLAARLFRTTGTTIGRTPLEEAWLAIAGLAQDAPKITPPTRVARHDSSIVLDLGDTTGRAIVVTSAGWELVDRSPITFARSQAQLPLDVPVHGGDIAELFTLLNVAPMHRDLFVGWLLATLLEDIPHPAVAFIGEHGAGKTSTARAIVRLVDPCTAATQRPPKNMDEWTMVCSARYVIAVDNVSEVKDWWSDELCRTVTGSGSLKRALWTDSDVVAIAYRRCIILNGITLGDSIRADLAERLIKFELHRPTQYLTEAEADARLDDMRPRVLGALLTLAAGVLRTLEKGTPDA